MRKLVAMVLTGLVLGISAAAAALPTPGIYNSTDLGGQVLTGHGSVSWTAPANGARGLGDVFNSQSWDGATLGTQWDYTCGVSPAIQTRVDNRNAAGTGTVVFTTNYSGGTFWLSKSGPWGDGVNDLTGTILNTENITTVQYVNWVPVQSRLNVNSAGNFDGSNCVLTFVIANGVGRGDTDLNPPKPATYPAFLDANCGSTRIYGSWGDLISITLQIDCPVPALDSTWGNIKALYR